MIIRNIAVAGVALLMLSCASTDKTTENALRANPSSYDGLELQEQEKFDLVYTKSNIDFQNYSKVLLIPGQVTFKENWARDYNRGHSDRVREKDVARIREKLSALVFDKFQEVLKNQNKFELVESTGTDVLILKPSVVNLDVTAPDLKGASRQLSLVKSAGEATLFLEVFDSVSGEILARVIDHQEDRSNGYFEIQSGMRNTVDVKRVIKKWTSSFQELLLKVK